MAHGAPDHVRMQDVNLLDYTDHVFTEDLEGLIGFEIWEFVNVVNVGCFGLVYYYGDSPTLRLKITCDGIVMFESNITTLWLALSGSHHPLATRCGITTYNGVTNRYGWWVDFNNQLSFKRRLQVEIENTGGAARQVRNLRCEWKEKE